MNDVEQQKATEDVPPSEAATGAEAKRLAARRRFLGRGAAAGSGLVIVTMYHERSFAQVAYSKVSSVEECHSIGGTTSGETVPGSITGTTRIKCYGGAR